MFGLDLLSALLANLIATASSKGAQTVAGRREWARHEELERLLWAQFTPEQLRLRIATRLLAEDAEERTIEQLNTFVTRHEGREAIKDVLASVAGGPLEPATQLALVGQCTALMALAARSEEPEIHTPAAKALIATVAECWQRAAPDMRRIAASTFASLQAEARFIRANGTMGAKTNRPERILHLIPQIDADLEEQVLQYIDRVTAATAFLTVPTLAEPLTTPLDEAFVQPEVQRRQNDLETTGLDDSFEFGVDPLNAAVRNVRSVILGDPGGGKSTLLRMIAHTASRSYQEETVNRAPFTVTLRDLAKHLRLNPESGILPYIHNEVNNNLLVPMSMSTLRYLLHVGRAIVLFDGLDEVLAVEERQKIASRIGNFAVGFPTSVVVVSARLVGYEETPVAGVSSQWVVLPFGEAQVARFAGWFFRVQPREGYTADVARTRFLVESSKIGDLRSNPLLLGVLCTLFAQGRSLPANRANLYRKCAEMLFEEWDHSRGVMVEVADRDTVGDAVRELALQVFQSGQEEISEDDIAVFLEDFYRRERGGGLTAAQSFAKAALKLWRGRQWILIYAGDRAEKSYYRFAHRSFLEYFAAEWLVYTTGTGEELWDHLCEYVRNRTAVQFTLLCVEMINRRTRRTVDGFITEALNDVGENALEVFSTVLLCTETLTVAFGKKQLRHEVVKRALFSMSEVLPVHTLNDVLRPLASSLAYEPLRIGHKVSEDADFSLRPPAPFDFSDLEDWDTTELEHEDAGLFLVALQHLGSEERSELLELIPQTIDEIIRNDQSDALRLSLFLLQLPDVATWASVDGDWKSDLKNVAQRAWREVLLTVSADMLRRSDGYVQVHYVRSLGPAWSHVALELGPKGMLTGGFPLGVHHDVSPGTPVHAVVLGLLGCEWPAASSPLSAGIPPDMEERWVEFGKELLAWHGSGTKDAFQNFDLRMRGVKLGTPRTRTWVENWVLAVGILAIDYWGDQDFLEQVASMFSADDWRSVAILLAARRHAGDLDPDVIDLSLFAEAPEGEREDLFRCVVDSF